MDDLLRVISLITIILVTKGIVRKVKNDAKPKKHSAAKRQVNQTAKRQPVSRTQAVKTAYKKREKQYHSLADSFKSIATALQSGENIETAMDKLQPAKITSKQSPTHQSVPAAGLNSERQEAALAVIEQKLQTSSVDMTFDEQVATLERNYNQFSAFLDTAVNELLPPTDESQDSETQVAKEMQRKSKLRVATDLNDIEQGIIMATVLEKRTHPRLPYARKKGEL